MPVPDGLDGVRVDAALAKMLGFSRTFAAEVAEAGGVRLDGRAVGKSDKLRADGWLEVEWSERREPEIVPIAVPDLGIVHDDDDIVVVDKPAGVAAHPSVGWEGPTVLGALAAAGLDPATLPATRISMPVRPWRDIWSAGHGVGDVVRIETVAELVNTMKRDYEAARLGATAQAA